MRAEALRAKALRVKALQAEALRVTVLRVKAQGREPAAAGEHDVQVRAVLARLVRIPPVRAVPAQVAAEPAARGPALLAAAPQADHLEADRLEADRLEERLRVVEHRVAETTMSHVVADQMDPQEEGAPVARVVEPVPAARVPGVPGLPVALLSQRTLVRFQPRRPDVTALLGPLRRLRPRATSVGLMRVQRRRRRRERPAARSAAAQSPFLSMSPI